MKILYARYSRERHPHFQMKTVIFEENGLKKVMKKAINLSGSNHVQQILLNYEVLKNQYKTDVLLDPIFTGDAITFEYLDHLSLEQHVLEAAMNKNREEFFYYIELYKQFINEVALDNYSEFSNTEEFVSFFKKGFPLEGLRTFVTPNIDLNFDNIFLLPHNKFKVLDYEWLLSFPVPVEFVVFRAINTFYYGHYSTLINFVDINELFELFAISLERIEYYIEMSISFAEFVGTNQAMEKGNEFLKEAIPLKFKEPEVLTAQLFYSSSEQLDFTEKNSTKLKIDANTNTLQYFIEPGVKHFRFDPVDKKSIVLLKNITVYDANDKAFVVNELKSNANFTINSNYFFATDDPQMYFTVESDFLVLKVVVCLEYINFIEKDFFLEMGQRYEMLMNNNSTLTHSINQMISSHSLEIEEKERLLQDSYEVKVYLNNEINKLNHKLEEQIIISEILSNELEISKLFINKIKSSIWWKIKNKTKSVVNKIIGKLKGIYK